MTSRFIQLSQIQIQYVRSHYALPVPVPVGLNVHIYEGVFSLCVELQEGTHKYLFL